MVPRFYLCVLAFLCLCAALAGACGSAEQPEPVAIVPVTQSPVAPQEDVEPPPTPSPTPTVAVPPTAAATPAPTPSPSPSPAGVACDEATVRRLVRPGVVQVVNERAAGQTTSGTGFAISGERIITNEHVVNGSARLTVVLPDGRRLPAQLLRADEGRDLALLGAPGAQLAPVGFGSIAALTTGQRLYTLGFPVSAGPIQEPLLTGGALLRTPEINGVPLLQTTIAAGVGNSGGPIVTACGELVGVVSSGTPDAGGVTYGIALTALQAFLAGVPALGLDSLAASPTPSPARQPTATPTTASPPVGSPSAASSPAASLRPTSSPASSPTATVTPRTPLAQPTSTLQATASPWPTPPPPSNVPAPVVP